MRVERAARLVVPRRGPALELLVLVGRQDAARREERRPPDRVTSEDGIVEAPREAHERVVDAHRVERDAIDVTVVGHGDVAAQVVLQHVVGGVTTEERTEQGQAAPRVRARGKRVAGDLALRVVELRHGVLLAGGVAGEQHLAALVHVRAELQHLVECQPVGVAAGAAGGAGDQVVSGLPDDRVVVAEHAECVRGDPPGGVDVVDVRLLAVGGQGVGVPVDEVRACRICTGEAPV